MVLTTCCSDKKWICHLLLLFLVVHVHIDIKDAFSWAVPRADWLFIVRRPNEASAAV